MCLWCAVPVRGVAYGAECVGSVIGVDQQTEPEETRPRPTLHVVIGFAVALAATVLPWTTFGEGSTVFGGWSVSPRWSLLAALAAAGGVAVAMLRLRRPGAALRWDRIAIGLGVVVVVGSILGWFRPPFPSRPSVVPWIAAAAGLFAAGSAVRCLLDDARPVS